LNRENQTDMVQYVNSTEKIIFDPYSLTEQRGPNVQYRPCLVDKILTEGGRLRTVDPLILAS